MMIASLRLLLEFISAMSSDNSSLKSLQSETVKRLMEENNIKDLALQKATKLIDLLTIELQAQKQSKEQQLRDLAQQYQNIIRGLLQKISSLEGSLSRSTNSTQPEIKQKRDESKCNISSQLQLTSQGYRTLNKKLFLTTTDIITDLSIVELDQILLYEEICKIEQIQTEAFQQLTTIAEEENQQINKIISQQQNYAENIDEAFEPLPSCLVIDQIKELRQVIYSQQAIINQLRHYIQELQDSYRSVLARLQSAPFDCIQVQLARRVEDAISQAKDKIVWAWRQQRLEWSLQNGELKSIVQKLIELVQGSRVCQSQFLHL